MADTFHPEPSPMNVGRKFFAVGVIAAILMPALLIIYALVWDRSSTAAEVKGQITQGWAGAQSLRGPLLVVPFEVDEMQTVVDKRGARQVVARRADALVLAPDDLAVAARLRPEKRQRSLFEVMVYDGDVSIDARFSTRAMPRTDVDPAALDWSRAFFVLGVSDPRGFGGAIPRLRIDGRVVEAEPGSRSLAMPGAALSVPAGLSAAPTAPIRVATSLRLKGSSHLTVDGTARRVTIDLASSWPHPSFAGGLLPDRRTVSGKGFAARWSTTHLALNKPLAELASAPEGALRAGTPVAGVSLIEPVDLYAQVGRAVKYGALIIALTFLTYFVFDVTTRRRIPVIAYALVGLGLVLFFLLLLALAEYLSLTLAYVIAAGALVGLISAYSKAVLDSTGRAAVIAGVLSLLYGVLYVLLRLEDFALLVGSLVLFVALAVLMYVTRDVRAEEPGERRSFLS